MDKRVHGGNNEESIMLNIDTFKNLCMSTSTTESKKIRSYYIKLENIYNKVVNQDYQKHQMQIENMQKTLEYNKQEIEMINKSRHTEKQNILLREFANIGSIVYIVKVKDYDNGSCVVKIGESRNGIDIRFKSHNSDYGNDVLLLDCFTVCNSRKLESFIHSELREFKVTDLDGHETENELFLVGNGLSYQHILELIQNNISRFNDNYVELEKLKLDNERLNVLNTLVKDSDFNQLWEPLLNSHKQLNNRLDNIENKLDELLRNQRCDTANTTSNFNEPLQTLGPRLQKINPETYQLVKVYESISEALKESNNKLKRSTINKVIRENRIYDTFRWNLVDRELDPTIVNIEPTKVTKIQKIGYISKLNHTQTEIVNVYVNRNVASLENGYKSSSYLDVKVKTGALTNGYYYKLYNECDKELRDEFEKKYSKPILYTTGIGKYTLNGELVKVFVSKCDCYTNDSIGNKSLTKALNDNKAYNGYIYKFLDHQKTSML
jgi:hypothetical protein